MIILDLDNARAQGAQAVLIQKRLTVRLNFKLIGAPTVKATASGRGAEFMLIPTRLLVEYAKTDSDNWEVTLLRVFGHPKDQPDEPVLNVYPHNDLNSRAVPAWIRDAAIDGMPK